MHLGYRKGQGGSAWVVRWYVGERNYKTASLEGRPDDVLEADGVTVLKWTQAQEKARELFQRLQREAAGLEGLTSGPYTVANALADYAASYERRGGRSLGQMKAAIEGRILPALGNIQLQRLTRKKIETWFDELSKTAPRLRSAKGKEPRYRKQDDGADTQRRRKSTANRILTILKAALNKAYQDRHVADDDAWRAVKSFRGVDAARVRYLSDDESRRLVNATSPEFRPLVQAALLTGARYGELIALQARDYNSDSGTVHIVDSKSGKPRHIVLTDEGRNLFEVMTNGKAGDALIYAKPSGTPWAKSHQQRPFKEAVKAAKLEAITFHELRHSYASRLVQNGAPLLVVAAQLGHSDTRMVEKHYGHLAPSYIADIVRSAFGPLGIVAESNVKPLKRGAK